MTESLPTGHRVILVAGGSGSIGASVAREALRKGWAVVIHGRSADKLSSLLAELRAIGPAEAIVLDIAAPGAPRQLADDAAAVFGRLDAVVDCVANGAPNVTGLFEGTDPTSYAPLYDRTAAWFQRLAHAALPHLRQSGGTLIAFVSDSARFAAARQSVIAGAMAATVGFVRSLAIEVARDGVRVHAISPSFVAGSASAVRMGSERMAKAEKRAGLGLPAADDIAPITVFLCGPGAMKITGQVISINGGLNA